MEFFDASAEDFADFGAVCVGRARDEREVGEVTGEPDAAADDDIRLGPRTAQPLAAGLSKLL